MAEVKSQAQLRESWRQAFKRERKGHESTEDLFERAKDWVKKYKAYCNAARHSRISDLIKYANSYVGKDVPKLYKTTSDAQFWQSFEVVEVIHPRLKKAFLSSQPPFLVETEPPLPMLQRTGYAQYMYRQMKKGEFRKFMEEFLRALLIYGTAIGEVGWDERVGNIPEIDDDGNIVGFTPYLDYQGLTFKNLSLLSVFCDPRYDDIQASQGIIVESLVPKEELFKNKLDINREQGMRSFTGLYENLDLLNEDGWEGKIAEDVIISAVSQTTSNRSERKVHLVDNFWGVFDYFNDGIPIECIITVADEEIILRCHPNPYPGGIRPFVHAYLYPSQDGFKPGFFGLTLVEIAYKLGLSMNSLANAYLDLVRFMALPPKIVWNQARMDLDLLQAAEPGSLHQADVPGQQAVYNLVPGQTFDITQAMGMVQNHIRETTGATLSLRGMPAKSDTTAYEVGTITGEAYAKIGNMAEHVDDTMFPRLLKIVQKLLFLNVTFPKKDESPLEEEVLNDKGNSEMVEIKKEMFAFISNIIPIGSTQLQNRMVLLQELFNLIKTFIPLPVQQVAGNRMVPMANFPFIIKQIGQAMGYQEHELINPEIFQQMMPISMQAPQGPTNGNVGGQGGMGGMNREVAPATGATETAQTFPPGREG